MFVGATFLGLVAVIVARLFLIAPAVGTPAKAATPSMANVVVAAAAIPVGTAIAPALLKQIALPVAALPAGVFLSVADAIGKGDKLALRPIDANELILAKAVSGGDDRLSTSGTIAVRMRAVAVRVSDVASVGGLLLPGDRVDVMVTRTTPGQLGGPVATEVQTDLIVQNAHVLAVDQDTNPIKQGADKAKVPATVTIEVGIEQAQKLALAQTVGTISLMLRASNDTGSAISRTIRLSDLHSGSTTSPGEPHRVSIVHRSIGRLATAKSDFEVVRGMTAQKYALAAAQ